MIDQREIDHAIRRYLDFHASFFPDDPTMHYTPENILKITILRDDTFTVYNYTITEYRVRLDLDDELGFVDLVCSFTDGDMTYLLVYADTDYVTIYPKEN